MTREKSKQFMEGPKRFAFLGASGRIGRLLRAVWSDVIATDLHVDWQFRTPQRDNKTTFFWPDLAVLDPFLARAALEGDFDGIFVFLGASRGGDKTDAGQMAVNVTLVDQALSAAAAARVSRVIVASSSAVYGAGHGTPFHESSALAPVNAYGEAKRDMEVLCRTRAAELGIEVCLLRIGNVAGADALLGSAAEWRSGDAPKQLDIYPDGEGPRRSYIGPVSLADVLKRLALSPQSLPSVINIAAPISVSMNALLDVAGIDWQPRPTAASPLQDIALDCSLLETLSEIGSSDGRPAALVAQWRRALEAL